MKFTIKNLKLANELAFPADIEKLFKKHFADLWRTHYISYINKRDFLTWVFDWSRADLDRRDGELGNKIDAMINEIIG